MQRIALNDPGNAHAIPYMWGTAGLGYNPAWSRRRSAPSAIDSWSAIFDPAIASKLAKCGIAMMDVPEDTFMVARIYLGLDAEQREARGPRRRGGAAEAMRPYIRYFNTSQLINDLASGEICVAFSWNGYVIQARDRGAAAATPGEDRLCDPEGRHVHLVRHGGDPGRRAASRTTRTPSSTT